MKKKLHYRPTILGSNSRRRIVSMHFYHIHLFSIFFLIYSFSLFVRIVVRSSEPEDSCKLASVMKSIEVCSSKAYSVEKRELEMEINSVLSDNSVLLTKNINKTCFKEDFALDMYCKEEQVRPSIALKNLILGRNSFVVNFGLNGQELKYALNLLKNGLDLCLFK